MKGKDIRPPCRVTGTPAAPALSATRPSMACPDPPRSRLPGVGATTRPLRARQVVMATGRAGPAPCQRCWLLPSAGSGPSHQEPACPAPALARPVRPGRPLSPAGRRSTARGLRRSPGRNSRVQTGAHARRYASARSRSAGAHPCALLPTPSGARSSASVMACWRRPWSRSNLVSGRMLGLSRHRKSWRAGTSAPMNPSLSGCSRSAGQDARQWPVGPQLCPLDRRTGPSPTEGPLPLSQRAALLRMAPQARDWRPSARYPGPASRASGAAGWNRLVTAWVSGGETGR